METCQNEEFMTHLEVARMEPSSLLKLMNSPEEEEEEQMIEQC